MPSAAINSSIFCKKTINLTILVYKIQEETRKTVEKIYLDNSATTKICDEALEKYVTVSKECYGNPSSLHGLGFDAEKLIDSVRACDSERLSLTMSSPLTSMNIRPVDNDYEANGIDELFMLLPVRTKE